MKYQYLFSLKNQKKYFKMSSAAVMTGALRVKATSKIVADNILLVLLLLVYYYFSKKIRLGTSC